MLLIMLMIYVWQRCWVSGCLVGCFSKNHIFLHSPFFDNRATAKWPIRSFCLLVPQVQLCLGQITALILKLCLVSPFSPPRERFYVLVSLPLPKSIIKASLTAGAVREHPEAILISEMWPESGVYKDVGSYQDVGQYNGLLSSSLFCPRLS